MPVKQILAQWQNMVIISNNVFVELGFIIIDEVTVKWWNAKFQSCDSENTYSVMVIINICHINYIIKKSVDWMYWYLLQWICTIWSWCLYYIFALCQTMIIMDMFLLIWMFLVQCRSDLSDFIHISSTSGEVTWMFGEIWQNITGAFHATFRSYFLS